MKLKVRVTRLSEFSPTGWLFTLGSFLKITNVAEMLGYFFPQLRWCITFVKNWIKLPQTFWAIFSQTLQGPMLWFLKYFRRKKLRKNGVLTRNKAKLCKFLIITLVFETNANFFAENWQKSQKNVIITSTPGHPALSMNHSLAPKPGFRRKM
jgi:hypothetical protein